jgi:transcriptional regulator with XRE-family HTH domain
MYMESIKKARKRRGMSLTEVAAESGLYREAVARAENANCDPRASTVARIAKAMGVPVCELFEESGHEQRKRKTKAKKK